MPGGYYWSRTSDLPLFRRTLVPTELSSRVYLFAQSLHRSLLFRIRTRRHILHLPIRVSTITCSNKKGGAALSVPLQGLEP